MTKNQAQKKMTVQPIGKGELVKELRAKIPQIEALQTHNKEIMLLVGRILNPSSMDGLCGFFSENLSGEFRAGKENSRKDGEV